MDKSPNSPVTSKRNLKTPHIYCMSTKKAIRNLVYFIVLLQVGCSTTSASSPKHPVRSAQTPVSERMPKESFFKFQVAQAIEACMNLTDDKRKCTVGVVKHTSSGAFIGISEVNNDIAYGLTAGHSCEDKFTKKSSSTVAFKVVSADYVTLMFNGKLRSAEIISYDMKSDLCLLRISGFKGNRPSFLKIAKNFPKWGEKVYNMAAPRGIFNPGMLLLFDGYYSGIGFDNYMFFTLPTKPGSSGSPIMNAKGELVSMIFAGFPAMENIGLGSNLTAIKTFVTNKIALSEADLWAKKNLNQNKTETTTTEPK